MQNLSMLPNMGRVCLTCAHATNQQEMRISHVHEVNSSRAQLLSMSHIKKYNMHQYFAAQRIHILHRVLYMFLSHLNLVYTQEELGSIHLPTSTSMSLLH